MSFTRFGTPRIRSNPDHVATEFLNGIEKIVQRARAVIESPTSSGENKASAWMTLSKIRARQHGFVTEHPKAASILKVIDDLGVKYPNPTAVVADAQIKAFAEASESLVAGLRTIKETPKAQAEAMRLLSSIGALGRKGYTPEIAALSHTDPHTLKNVGDYLTDNLGKETITRIKSRPTPFVIAVGEGRETLNGLTQAGWKIGRKIENRVGFHEVYEVQDPGGKTALLIARVNGEDRVIHIQSMLKLADLPAARLTTIGKSKGFQAEFLAAFQRAGAKPDAVIYGYATPTVEALVRSGGDPSAIDLFEKGWKVKQAPSSTIHHDLDGFKINVIRFQNGKTVWVIPALYGDLSTGLARALREHGVKDITFLSTAGGINPALRVGDIVSPTATLKADGTLEPLDWIKPFPGATDGGTHVHVATPNVETTQWLDEVSAQGGTTVEVELKHWLPELAAQPQTQFRTGLVITDVLQGPNHRDMTAWGWQDGIKMQPRVRNGIKAILGVGADQDLPILDYRTIQVMDGETGN